MEDFKKEYLREKLFLFKKLKEVECLLTASVENPVENSLVFVRNKIFYEKLVNNITKKNIKNIYLILDNSFDVNVDYGVINTIIKTKFAEILFAEYHNSINLKQIKDEISDNAFIHDASHVGLTGLWIRKTPESKTIKMKHIGNVVLEDGVYIDACTTIHRGTFGSTIIKRDTHLSCHINVGHNCSIGSDCFIGPHVGIGGSTIIGNNVKIWQGAMIRNGIEICDNVVIGMGSIVTKNIEKSGTYVGSPAKLFSKKMIKV